MLGQLYIFTHLARKTTNMQYIEVMFTVLRAAYEVDILFVLLRNHVPYKPVPAYAHRDRMELVQNVRLVRREA